MLNLVIRVVGYCEFLVGALNHNLDQMLPGVLIVSMGLLYSISDKLDRKGGS